MPFNDLHLVTTNTVAASDVASPSGKIQDSIIASSLISAPAWSTWLNQLNGWLTTFSLIIGLMIGLHRLWLILKPTSSISKNTSITDSQVNVK